MKNRNHGPTWVTLSLLAVIIATVAYYFVDNKPATTSADQAITPDSKTKPASSLTSPEATRPEDPGEDATGQKASRKKAYPRPKNAID